MQSPTTTARWLTTVKVHLAQYHILFQIGLETIFETLPLATRRVDSLLQFAAENDLGYSAVIHPYNLFCQLSATGRRTTRSLWTDVSTPWSTVMPWLRWWSMMLLTKTADCTRAKRPTFTVTSPRQLHYALKVTANYDNLYSLAHCDR